MARIVAVLAVAAMLATGCTHHGTTQRPAPASVATTAPVGPAVDNNSRADWLDANGYPAWALSADTFQQHFRSLCRQLAAASVPGKERVRARLVRQWSADVQSARAAGFGPMEFKASGVSDHPASLQAFQRAGGGC